MKQLLAIAFITLLALGTGCAWISPSSQTTSDGIQVHGHWTVTVTNPDGTVDAVHEFENELDEYGDDFIAAILTRETSISGEMLRIGQGSSASPMRCRETFLYPGQTQAQAENYVFAWTVPAVVTRNEGTFMFTGTCTIVTEQTNITINQVETMFHVEPNMTVGTGSWKGIPFTQHNFSTPAEAITAKPNQAVTFNVDISFE